MLQCVLQCVAVCAAVCCSGLLEDCQQLSIPLFFPMAGLASCVAEESVAGCASEGTSEGASERGNACVSEGRDFMRATRRVGRRKDSVISSDMRCLQKV